MLSVTISLPICFNFSILCRCGIIPKVITAFQPIWTAWTTSFFELICQKMSLPVMVGGPSHEQIISPNSGNIMVVLKSMTALTLTSVRPFFEFQMMQIPLKTELKNMNKACFMCLCQRFRGLGQGRPQLLHKILLHPKTGNGCYWIYCFSLRYWNSYLLLGAC